MSVADSEFLFSYFNLRIDGSSLNFFPRATFPYFAFLRFSLSLVCEKLGIILDFVMVGTLRCTVYVTPFLLFLYYVTL